MSESSGRRLSGGCGNWPVILGRSGDSENWLLILVRSGREEEAVENGKDEGTNGQPFSRSGLSVLFRAGAHHLSGALFCRLNPTTWIARRKVLEWTVALVGYEELCVLWTGCCHNSRYPCGTQGHKSNRKLWKYRLILWNYLRNWYHISRELKVIEKLQKLLYYLKSLKLQKLPEKK